MRFAATLAVPLTGLALSLCPVAQADPSPDDLYAQALSSASVSFKDLTWPDMIAMARGVCETIRKNPTTAGVVGQRDAIVNGGVFSKQEANGIIYAATYAYCPNFQAYYYGAGLGPTH